GGQEEGNESNDDSDDRSDKDSEETVKFGAGKDSDEDDDENDYDDDKEEETAKDDKETEETGKRGDEVRERGDTHVILTPVNPDDQQESSSMSSFVLSMLNPLSDEGVESIFMTTSSQTVSLVPPTPILIPSTIATITTSGEAQIPPPTIPSIILEN
nr:hypothetical protein [Tanacetum cinerariifolium]